MIIASHIPEGPMRQGLILSLSLWRPFIHSYNLLCQQAVTFWWDISEEMLKISDYDMTLKIMNSRLQLNLWGSSELRVKVKAVIPKTFRSQWHSTLSTGSFLSWWCHQMETFSTLLALCAGNSSFIVEFPSQRPVMRSFEVSFGLRLNQHLSKQWKRQWFEMPSLSLWHHCNV